MEKILRKLQGGDLRSKGKSEEVVKDMENNLTLLPKVISGLFDEDPIIRMRVADALEKYSVKHSDKLQKYNRILIWEASKTRQQEVRWHLAQIYGRLSLSKHEMDHITIALLNWIRTDNSRIVIVFCMQTIADFAKKDPSRKRNAINLIEKLMLNKSPAIIARGKMLLDDLEKMD
jgi:hypothetical protein